MSTRLVAEIGADTSGFETGLNRADLMVEKFTHKVTHHLVKAFGYGFLAHLIFEAPKSQIEAAEKIEEGAKKMHVTTDEYQELGAAAKDAGMEINEFIKKNAEQGVMLDSLVKRVGEYRNQIKMTREEVEQWVEIGQAGKSMFSGMVAPIAWIAKKAYNLGAVGLNLGGAAIGSMANGFGYNFNGINTEDYLLEASRQGHNLFGLGTEGLKDEGGKALPRPAGYGQQKAYDSLTNSLRVLKMQEESMRQQSRSRFSIWSPGLTDWEQGGAGGFSRVVTMSDKIDDGNQRLEEIRKEIQETNEELRKLREGA